MPEQEMLNLSWWTSPALTAMLPLFVLACGLLLPTYLTRVKRSELERLASSHSGIEATRPFRAASEASDHFGMGHYVLPVAFLTFQVTILSYLTFFGARITPLATDFLLGGAKVVDANGYQAYAMQTLCTVSYAFFGAFIWTIQNLISRIIARNVTPAAFYSMSINMLLAVVVATVLHHVYHGGLASSLGLPEAKDAPALMIVLAFFTGMAPNRTLKLLRSGLKLGGDDEAAQVPLTTLQGISPAIAFQLHELSIGGVQNLAEANPVELYMMTPAPIQACMDWVGQAQLHLFYADKVAALLPLGVRTILDFNGADDAILAGLTGWSEAQVTNAKARLERIPAFANLSGLNAVLLEAQPVPLPAAAA